MLFEQWQYLKSSNVAHEPINSDYQATNMNVDSISLDIMSANLDTESTNLDMMLANQGTSRVDKPFKMHEFFSK